MAQFVWVDMPTPSGSVPPTFTAWGGFVLPTVAVVPVPAPATGTPAPVPPPKVTCELLDLNLPAPTQANPNSRRVQLVDPCGFFCNGTQWRANFGGGGNPIPAGTNYQIKARLFVGGVERDNDTIDPFTVAENGLLINPACPIVDPNPGGGVIPIPRNPTPNPVPVAPGLGAAVGGLPAVEAELAAVQTTAFVGSSSPRSFPISFDFPWDPRIVTCLGLVFPRGTSNTISVTVGQLTIGRCGVSVPIPTFSGRFTARVLLLDAIGQVLVTSPDIGLPR